jgi:hypothetical protein
LTRLQAARGRSPGTSTALLTQTVSQVGGGAD